MFGRRKRPKSGTLLTEGVAYCSDPALVDWPAHYATTRNKYGHEVVDKKVQVEWSEVDQAWRVK